MKRVLVITATVLISATCLMARGLKGTKHDFSTAGNAYWNTRAGNGTNAMEICYPCHTPHHGNADTGYLWNHKLADNTGFDSEVTNFSAVMKSTGKSMMCLGCHDGVTGLDSYAGVTNGTVNIPTSSRANIGTDLTDDHPIGVSLSGSSWPTPVETNMYGTMYGLVTASFTNAPYGTNTSTTVNKTSLRLEESQTAHVYVIGCGTCHRAHDNDYGYFLRANNYGSQLCITCHGTKWDGVASH